MISAILHAPADLCSPQKSAEKTLEKYEIKGIALGINSAVEGNSDKMLCKSRTPNWCVQTCVKDCGLVRAESRQ